MHNSERVLVLISDRDLYLKRKARRGRAAHIWTDDLRKAHTFSSLREARKYVLEFGIKYPYDEYDSKTLVGAWFREVTLQPENSRYEVFDRSKKPVSCEENLEETSEEESD